MNSTKRKPGSFSGNMAYIILSGLVSIPIFLVLETIVKSLEFAEDEAIATGFTIMVIAGVFAGRYIGNVLAHRMDNFPVRLLVSLSLLSLGLVVWLFFYADFPLRNRPSITTLLFALPLLVLSIAVGTIIKIVRSITKKQLFAAQSSAAQSASELQLLQSQISPHFLFNTLNNMYGLSITQHEKIPPLLLKLSELLRYTVYDANQRYVPLNDELTYINNYIEFEKIRIGERLALTMDIEDFKDTNIKIAPMLLIVFIENAFKHSKNSTNERIFIHMSVKTWGNRILFSIVNSYSSEGRLEAAAHSGLGLANVKKRLDLLYGEDYHLVMEDSDDTYKVMLQLKMK